MNKKALIFVLTFTLALCIASFALPEVSGTANAASRNAETKSFCNDTVDDDFAEDRGQ